MSEDTNTEDVTKVEGQVEEEGQVNETTEAATEDVETSEADKEEETVA